jgi:uncharacterized membrane protein YbhN (UPF0104 family)
MFYSVLFATILVFSGATVFWPLLRNHPFLFLGYWAVCVWITILACLLAVYDMAKVREEGRRERERLRAEYLESLKLPQVSASEKPVEKSQANPPDERE